MKTCLQFSDHVRSFAEQCRVIDRHDGSEGGVGAASAAVTRGRRGGASQSDAERRQERINVQTEFIKRESEHESFGRYLTNFENEFDKMVS